MNSLFDLLWLNFVEKNDKWEYACLHNILCKRFSISTILQSSQRTNLGFLSNAKLDISDFSDIQSVFVIAFDKFDRVDEVINNAEYSEPFEGLLDS